MRKYVLSLFLLSVALTAFSQKKSIVNLIRSKSSTGIKVKGKDIVKVYQGTFKQDYSTLTSDSAYFYIQDNAVDAFGHVNINQGDTLNIYSDKLNYNGNTKIAILTDNVRLVDKGATLTTNHLTYNTATRIGIYTDGGKLVDKDNTLLSKNGYYFAFSRDSYFRYNVSLTTPDALVKTDTMRYNTGSKIAYFYGPTNIYGRKGEKDKDTLYTENGTYNTVNEQAAFGKKNLYKSGTKSLKGDSLFYDKLKGYGRAVKHVTFNDKEQKITIKGDLGTYLKEGERTIMTQDPYVIMVTEVKDSTKTDSAAKPDSLFKKREVKKRNAITMNELIKKTIPSKADTVQQRLNTITRDQSKADSIIKSRNAAIVAQAIHSQSKIDTSANQQKLIGVKADSAARKRNPPVKGARKGTSAKPAAGTKLKSPNKTDNKTKVSENVKAVKDTGKVKLDSIYMSADTIETRILTYKDLKIYQEKQRLAHIRDTTAKPKKTIVKEKPSKRLVAMQAGLPPIDSSYLHREFFGKAKPVVTKKKLLSKRQLALDSLNKARIADSIITAKKLEPSDTARIRIIMAYHQFKAFKSDLQAKSDSMYYSNSDSTIRCFDKPMIWTQGSQLSGDTIYLQMKHKKLDNLTMFPSAFIVNVEKDDSVHFNQVAGKRMRGFFKDDKLSTMFILGNAESIYFSRDSGKTTVNGMQRSLSSRINVYFKNNKVTNLGFYTKPQNTYGPLDKFKEDDKILKGFIWKPKERPVSKESIIPSYHKKAIAVKGAPGKTKTGKPLLNKKGKQPLKPRPAERMANDSTATVAPGSKAVKDSTLKGDTTKLQIKIPHKDSVIAKPTPVKSLPAKN